MTLQTPLSLITVDVPLPTEDATLMTISHKIVRGEDIVSDFTLELLDYLAIRLDSKRYIKIKNIFFKLDKREFEQMLGCQ